MPLVQQTPSARDAVLCVGVRGLASRVSLGGLRDAQRAGNALSLGVSGRVCLKKMHSTSDSAD